MNNLFLLISSGVETTNIIFLVFDILIVIAAFIFLIWMYIKTKKVNLKVKARQNAKEVKKLDDDTYILLSKENLEKDSNIKDIEPEKKNKS